MRSRFLPLCLAALLAGSGGLAVADDGEMVNKNMVNNVEVPQEVLDNYPGVEDLLPESEHAFTDMLLFYVPMQRASGVNGEDLVNVGEDDDQGNSHDPRDYYNIDGELVETLPVAKPLVNTFIYGPVFEPEGTAFLHSWMDTYAAVSLDDGMTWKKTNLSDSAGLSSFNIETDHVPGGGNTHPLPADHTILLSGGGLTSGYHAPGYDLPYTNGCTECHGALLTGGEHATSCYACHGSVWNEDNPTAGTVPQIEKAEWKDGNGGIIKGKGDEAPPGSIVYIINPLNDKTLGTANKPANKKGKFEFNIKRLITDGVIEKAPCQIAAVANGVEGPAVTPKDTPEDCEGYELPVDIAEYPGGTYNVFMASAGNKVLVAWPSRFCQQGQPAYSFAYDGDDSDILEDAEKGAELIAKREAVAELLEIDVESDLYLSDLFGVGGSQGSIDFADEGYPQAGIVPFGCVWTARGILLPGDDPRTEEAVEASHMVWTKAERLTSGRRDPNRIEVHGVPGAGFVITWQEDPDGLRPGEGEGPGEGWSGAVAHNSTDIWYSFINWEYFDLVEATDAEGEPVPTEYVNVAEHDLLASGRPQVFVPMAMPMRLSNNDKCQADTYGPDAPDLLPTDKKYFNYCNYDVAQNYGLQDFCADTVEVPQGPNDELRPICVNADGLPNLANTASTRPRTALQGYDVDDDGVFDSAWVIVAAEESKGLGRYAFLPDGTACDADADDASPDCSSDIGKNQWYFSFDMGKPNTSEPLSTDEDLNRDSLVANLVSQGNLLNQPEVDWRTGEFYPVINTSEMWDFGEYNFDLYNTEIARRSSMLSQGIKKAMESSSGLTALPSWKQGAMQQGGPADTMFRRIVFDFGGNGGGEECPIDANVDDDQPVVESARYIVNPNGSIAFRVTVSGLDGDITTGVQIANAVTGEQFGARRYLDNGVTTVDFGISLANWPNVPCAVQAAEGPRSVTFANLQFGPWVPVANAPANCVGPIPDACTAAAGGGSWDPSMGNPYAFRNMECETWAYDDGSNPYYPEGVCLDPATNLSGTVPDTCVDDGGDDEAEGGEPIPCPTVDFTSSTFGIGDTNPILQGYIQGEGNTTRVLTWHQCPSDSTVVAGDFDPVTCDTDDRTDDFANLKDQSWYNPLDVSKGHRGYLDGDFVMFLHAWSPNWRLNAKGNDRYDLYIRRSFDGGVTWTTTPSSFTASNGESYTGNGTVTCESYRPETTGTGDIVDPKVCYEFPAGGNEHARNVTQHERMRITTLDPRYAPSGGPRGSSISETCIEALALPDAVDGSTWSCDDQSLLTESEDRDPSRYAIVFETGDNNTVVDGEAEPLDLFYSRAEQFGDHYVVWAETDSGTADLSLCYPNDPHDDPKVVDTVLDGSGFCNEFDRMNTRGDTRSSEADLEFNMSGTKLYAVWGQWVYEDDDHTKDIIEASAQARRVWWIDDYICAGTLDPDCAWSLPGVNQPDDAEPINP